jgi:hypothetical protein
MTIKEFINRIYKLISEGDLKTAISELRNLLQKSKQLDEIIIQSARYNDLMQKIRTGMISTEDEEVMKNKLRYAILDMVREMEENLESNTELKLEIDKVLKEQEKNFTMHISTIGNNSSGNTIIQGSNTNGGNIIIGK